MIGCFFFQAEDGIRDFCLSRGLGDVYKRQAVLYLRIYFLGIIPTMLYNSGAGILQAVGDSRRPLCFLTIASVLNIILDLVFVIQLNMGVAGVAWATLIAQTVSCILVAVTLLRSKESYQIIPKKIRIDKPMLMQIVRLGIPSGLQQMIVSFSNVLVMSYVNRFGSAAIAGFSSANKFDNFLGLPVNSFMLAITTFVGQNMGCLLYTSPSPRDRQKSRMPSSA